MAVVLDPTPEMLEAYLAEARAAGWPPPEDLGFSKAQVLSLLKSTVEAGEWEVFLQLGPCAAKDRNLAFYLLGWLPER